MTTHRLRYLQSLRQQLPEPFDILLHKQSPIDQLILPHLVVQCGEKHVHALSELLTMSLLDDGVRSPIVTPRYAFEKMSTDEAEELFQTQDAYVKALQWFPFLLSC
jgi:hypothetical protein